MAATGNKKTYEKTLNPVKSEKKKRKLDSVFIRFLKILIIINAFLPNRFMEFDDFNNDLDYIITPTYAWEEPTPRPAAMESRSGNCLIIKIKLYQWDRLYNIKVLLDNGNNILFFFIKGLRVGNKSPRARIAQGYLRV